MDGGAKEKIIGELTESGNMSKVYVVIRTVGETTLDKCVDSVKRLGLNYVILKNYKPLSCVAKETIKIASDVEGEYEWVMALDADIELTIKRDFLELYCETMKQKDVENKIKTFCFDAYLDCTKRKLIQGLHFYRTKYAKLFYDNIKDVDFDWHIGRQEYEMKSFLQSKFVGQGYVHGVGYKIFPFGIHYFEK